MPNQREQIARTLADHPVSDFTEDGYSVLHDPLGVHKPQQTDNGKPLNFTKKDLNQTILRLKNDIHFFQKTMLKLRGKEFQLSPKQLTTINACKMKQFVAAVFNRQGGKSTTLGVLDVHELAFAEDYRLRIYAPILDQSEIIFGRNVKAFIDKNEILRSYINPKGGWKSDYIQFYNDNEASVMSASDQSHVRGHDPTVIQIDESQDISDYKYHEDILPSGASTDAKIQEAGTPKGRNHFYDTFQDDTYYTIKQIWTECPFISINYINMMKKKLPKKSFDQEFNGVWNVDSGSAFDKAFIDQIFVIKEFENVDTDYSYYGGVDIGKDPARTVLSVFREDFTEDTDESFYDQTYLRTYFYASYKDIIDELGEDLVHWNPLVTGMDRTGVGDPVVDMIDDVCDGIEPIFYAPGKKQSMVDKFTVLGERGCVRLVDDFDQRQQFMNWRKKKLQSGRYQYFKEKGEGDDVINADILAIEVTDEEGGRLIAAEGSDTHASHLPR